MLSRNPILNHQYQSLTKQSVVSKTNSNEPIIEKGIIGEYVDYNDFQTVIKDINSEQTYVIWNEQFILCFEEVCINE